MTEPTTDRDWHAVIAQVLHADLCVIDAPWPCDDEAEHFGLATRIVDALGLRGWPHSYQPNNPHVTAAREARAEAERLRERVSWELRDHHRQSLRETIERAITDQAPVWDHTFPEGNQGLVVGVPDASVIAAAVAEKVLHYERLQLDDAIARLERLSDGTRHGALEKLLRGQAEEADQDSIQYMRERDEARTREAKTTADAARLRELVQTEADLADLRSQFAAGHDHLHRLVRVHAGYAAALRALLETAPETAPNNPTTDEPAPEVGHNTTKAQEAT